jgi:hypothetical protein
MERKKISLVLLFITVSAFSLAALLLGGCGSGGSDPSAGTVSDKVWYVINVTIPMDSSNARACKNDVDVLADDCSDGTFLVDHTTSATFTLTRVDPDTDPGILELDSYTIDYIPMSPNLPVIPSFTVYQTQQIKKGDNTVTLEVMDVGRKNAFWSLFASGQQSDDILPAAYTASYTFKGQNSYGQSWSYHAQAPIFVGEYDECAPCN